ncbi:permease prefix domain 1-containing protein [Microbacterium sp. BWT-B31]|uniref:permease prefix domain 1-containing protein n=1 Tax=Microbacterium sp. BWT-B31 TaxID=3232072 RepID=UPI0035275C33
MNATLTDRYVDAAMRTVPERQREDLAAELRASIEDQIDARLASGDSREAAEHAVLTELGDPDRLAAGYTGRPLWLVGPRYFLDWRRLLKLLLAIVPVCAAFGVALAQTLSGASFGDIVGAVFGVVFQVVIHLVFWVTLVFVVLERTGHETMNPGKWTPESLPQLRENGATFGELIGNLVFLAIGAGAVLWDHFIGFAPAYPGMSFLADDLWPWWIAGLFVVMALEALLSIAVFALRRWTIPFAVVNGILSLGLALTAVWLLTAGRLINPEFFPTIIADGGAEVGTILTVILGFVFAGIAVWDTTDAALKATRGRGLGQRGQGAGGTVR